MKPQRKTRRKSDLQKIADALVGQEVGLVDVKKINVATGLHSIAKALDDISYNGYDEQGRNVAAGLFSIAEAISGGFGELAEAIRERKRG